MKFYCSLQACTTAFDNVEDLDGEQHTYCNDKYSRIDDITGVRSHFQNVKPPDIPGTLPFSLIRSNKLSQLS